MHCNLVTRTGLNKPLLTNSCFNTVGCRLCSENYLLASNVGQVAGGPKPGKRYWCVQYYLPDMPPLPGVVLAANQGQSTGHSWLGPL